MSNSQFHYFGYGSNLLKQRIQLMNPSAKFVGIGHLPNYKVNFKEIPGRVSEWRGDSATIDPTENSSVWGVVWTLDDKDMTSLDEQEGVPSLYKPIEVEVTLASDNERLVCRSYRICSDLEGIPSPYYLDVILRGAVQAKLPQDYIELLRQTPHNEYMGQCDLYNNILTKLEECERNNVEVKCIKNL